MRCSTRASRARQADNSTAALVSYTLHLPRMVPAPPPPTERKESTGHPGRCSKRHSTHSTAQPCNTCDNNLSQLYGEQAGFHCCLVVNLASGQRATVVRNEHEFSHGDGDSKTATRLGSNPCRCVALLSCGNRVYPAANNGKNRASNSGRQGCAPGHTCSRAISRRAAAVCR